MPRILFGATERKKEIFKAWIFGSMKAKKISQEKMAELLGIHRLTFRNRLESMTFDYGDLLTIFKVLEADPEVIKEKMTM